MKTSLAFLYDNKSGNIQLIDKKRLVKELITNINTKENKILNNKECDKLFNLSYKNIIQELGDKYFKKLSIGIYNTKLHDKSNVVVLINKTTKDFEKYCKKNNLKFGQEVDKIELKNDKKVVIHKLNTPINNKKDIKIDNSIIEKWRKTKMNKNNLNKVIKKGAIVIAASLATMSLFGCNSKVEGNKTYTTYPIDQDEQISNGDKIVTKEDKTNLGNETNVQDNEQAIKDAMALYNVDSSIAERTTWKKVYHKWPEPPEEQKIYTKKDEDNNNTSYVFPYYYKGKAYWIGTSNNSSTGNMRYIYKKTSDNYRDAGNKDNVMIVGADKTEEIWQLLEILEAGDNIVAGTTKGKVKQHTKWGID